MRAPRVSLVAGGRPMRVARLWCGICFVILAALGGCGRPASPLESDAPSSLARQIQQCADGQRVEIVSAEPVSAAQWERMVTLSGLVRLELWHCALPSLPGLDRLVGLERLRLGDFEADDRAAQQIAALTKLRVLNLPAGQFTDAGLAAIAQLPELELLRFRSRRVTDAGMPAMAAAPSLRFLHLIEVPITDAGLRPLYACDGLESLYLDGSAVTDAGIRELLAALPELHFHRDQLHVPGDPLDDGHSSP